MAVGRQVVTEKVRIRRSELLINFRLSDPPQNKCVCNLYLYIFDRSIITRVSGAQRGIYWGYIVVLFRDNDTFYVESQGD